MDPNLVLVKSSVTKKPADLAGADKIAVNGF